MRIDAAVAQLGRALPQPQGRWILGESNSTLNRLLPGVSSGEVPRSNRGRRIFAGNVLSTNPVGYYASLPAHPGQDVKLAANYATPAAANRLARVPQARHGFFTRAAGPNLNEAVHLLASPEPGSFVSTAGGGRL